jgi:hypothetical protein
VVALDAAGRPSFNALQNGSAGATIVYYVFDVMVLGGRDVMGGPLATRRDLLTREVLPLLAEPVREAPRFDAALADLIALSAHRDWRAWSPSGSTAFTSPAHAPGRGARCGSTARRRS